MTAHPLPDALTLSPLDDGTFSAVLTGDFSNGPSGMAPESGKPFGGLLAAHATTAMPLSTACFTRPATSESSLSMPMPGP